MIQRYKQGLPKWRCSEWICFPCELGKRATFYDITRSWQTGCTRQCSVCCQVTHGKILGRQHQQDISYQGPWGQEHNSNSVGPAPWNFFAFSPVFPQDSYVSLPSQDWPVLSIESLPASSDLWTFRQLHFSLSIHRLLSTRTSSNVLVSSLLQSSLSVRILLLHFRIFHFPFFH